jgi:hypothetical protein
MCIRAVEHSREVFDVEAFIEPFGKAASSSSERALVAALKAEVSEEVSLL